MTHDPFGAMEPDDAYQDEEKWATEFCMCCDERFPDVDLHRCCICGHPMCINCHGHQCSSVSIPGALTPQGWPFEAECVCKWDYCIGQLVMLRLTGGRNNG